MPSLTLISSPVDWLQNKLGRKQKEEEPVNNGGLKDKLNLKWLKREKTKSKKKDKSSDFVDLFDDYNYGGLFPSWDTPLPTVDVDELYTKVSND